MAEDTDYGTGDVSLILTTISNREFDFLLLGTSEVERRILQQNSEADKGASRGAAPGFWLEDG